MRTIKKVPTPFHDDKIARPVENEQEIKGVLAPIATKVLMKILFAARMARFDLLRAVQGLASRVTKWSADCDKALHRLVCYVDTTKDLKMSCFIGDPITQCRLWIFADADHAGEHDSKSTSGCVLALVGPNTYYPLTAFSKKQTSVSMSSTESEVVAANVSLRAVGLPSAGLWAYLQNAGGISTKSPPEGKVVTKVDSGDYWIYEPHRFMLSRVHKRVRNALFDPESTKDCPVNCKMLGRSRTTIMIDEEAEVDLMQDDWKFQPHRPVKRWTGRTLFRVYGMFDIDYQIESTEIREAVTDWDYVGDERIGSASISLFGPMCLRGVFVEDNQSTIRILESISSHGQNPKSEFSLVGGTIP